MDFSELGIDKTIRYEITEESIGSIPNIDFFNQVNINQMIVSGCKEVLSNSLYNKNELLRGCEQGLLISIINKDEDGNNLSIIHETFEGTESKILMDDRFENIVKTREVYDLIFIHNHPNNSVLSYLDLRTLSNKRNLVAVVAVGNTENLYIALDKGMYTKLDKFVTKYRLKYIKDNNYSNISEQDESKLQNWAALMVAANPDHFNVRYENYKRRKA